MVVIREKSQNEKNEFKEVGQSDSIDITLSNKDTEKTLSKKISSIIFKENYYIQNGSRNYKYIYCSQPQEHSFNFPMQIGTHGDNPLLAKEEEVQLEEGDLVILGTDGLFDNMYKYMILDTIEEIQDNKNIRNVGTVIGKKAFDLSLNENYLSPFSINAKISIGRLYIGGKSDDITISLAYTERVKVD